MENEPGNKALFLLHVPPSMIPIKYSACFPPSLCSLVNSRGVVDELVWEEEIAAREAGYGATSSVPKVRLGHCVRNTLYMRAHEHIA